MFGTDESETLNDFLLDLRQAAIQQGAEQFRTWVLERLSRGVGLHSSPPRRLAHIPRPGDMRLARLPVRHAVDSLPGRMREVACLAARGHSNKYIAAQMNISPNTVRNHLALAYERLAVRNKAEMAGLLLRFERDVTPDKGR